MKKILFPTEFSDHAPKVFEYAAELAYFFNARLIVMHAYGKPDYRRTSEEDVAKRATTVKKNLIDFVNNNLPKAYRDTLEVDYFAPVNYPIEAILGVALEEEVDLIVMGMTGKTNALETIFGSTVLGVLAKADCPVLTVPASAKFEGIDNLVYMTNFEFRDLGAINYLKKWSKLLDAPIHCLHVLGRQENEVIAMKNVDILEETYKGQKMVMFDMVKGDFQKEIENFAKRKQADIVAMTTHKSSFISRLLKTSTVNGVAQRIHIPLLVIKDNAYELDNNPEGWLNMINSVA